jgi:hypothetical protein
MLWIVLCNEVHIILDFINFNCDRKLHEKRKTLEQNEDFIVLFFGSYRERQVSLIFNPKVGFFSYWKVWGNVSSHLLQTEHYRPTRNIQCNFKLSWIVTTVLHNIAWSSHVIEYAQTHQYYPDLNKGPVIQKRNRNRNSIILPHPGLRKNGGILRKRQWAFGFYKRRWFLFLTS